MAGETLTAQFRGFNPQGLGAPLVVIMMLAMVVIPLLSLWWCCWCRCMR